MKEISFNNKILEYCLKSDNFLMIKLQMYYNETIKLKYTLLKIVHLTYHYITRITTMTKITH